MSRNDFHLLILQTLLVIIIYTTSTTTGTVCAFQQQRSSSTCDNIAPSKWRQQPIRSLHHHLTSLTTLLLSSSSTEDDASSSADSSNGDDDESSIKSESESSYRKIINLNKIIKLRGPVASGYGRGSKKLGFPTANLPSSLFQDALCNINTGVYFGWCVIEQKQQQQKQNKRQNNVVVDDGRNVQHKAVVNVGYSPTFEGNENKEKIVETYLILDDDNEQEKTIKDFYNETIRLMLIGYIRPEMKFNTFQDLIDNIKQDVIDAKTVLSNVKDTTYYYRSFQYDTFISDPCRRHHHHHHPTTTDESSTTSSSSDSSVSDIIWIGKDGGNDIASWEFDDWNNSLENIKTIMNRG